MAIAPVNGAKNNAGANTTILSNYTPTSGNTVIVFLSVNGAITNVTCKDSNNNLLAAGPTATNGTTIIFSFFVLDVLPGATSFTCSWTTSRVSSIMVEEYSGANGINPSLTGNSATGTSATASISVTTEDNNDFIVCGLADVGNTLTGSVGTQRQQVIAGSSCRQTLMDNTAATPSSVTCSATLTSSAWAAVAIELRLIQPGFVNSAVGGVTAGTSAVVTISPKAGNLVIIGVALLLTSDSVSSITDSVGKTKYFFVGAINNSTAARIELWAGFINGSPTTITVNFAITTVEVVVAEYEDVAVLGLNTTGIDTGTAATLTQTSEDTNNVMVEVISVAGNTTYSSGTGSLRNSGTQNAVIGCALADNTASNAGASITVSIVLGASIATAKAMVELRSVAPTFVEPHDETPSFDITLNNNCLSLSISEPNYGDSVEVPPSLIQMTAAFYDYNYEHPGFDIRATMGLLSQGMYEAGDGDYIKSIILPPNVGGIVLMGYSGYRISKAAIGFFEDPGLLPITAVVQVYNDLTNDAENQIQYQGFSLGDGLGELGDYSEQPPVIPSYVYDDDTKDQSSNQTYTIDYDLSDYGTELIILPPLSELLDYEYNQLSNDNAVGNLASDAGEITNFIILPPLAEVFDDERQQFSIETKVSNLASDSGQDWTDLIIYGSGVIKGWDTDSENQISNQVQFSSDTLSDDGVENIIIPFRDLTLDVDQQLSNDVNYAKNQDPEDRVIRIFISVQDLTPTEDQLLQAPIFGQDDVLDSGVELIILPPFNPSNLPANEDYQNQIQWVGFYKDHLSDESVEKITLPPTVPLLGLDSDTDYQLQNLFSVFASDDQGNIESTNLVILPPFINIVEDVGGDDDE